jgi:hypothetical protein
MNSIDMVYEFRSTRFLLPSIVDNYSPKVPQCLPRYCRSLPESIPRLAGTVAPLEGAASAVISWHVLSTNRSFFLQESDGLEVFVLC